MNGKRIRKEIKSEIVIMIIHFKSNWISIWFFLSFVRLECHSFWTDEKCMRTNIEQIIKWMNHFELKFDLVGVFID